MKQWQLLIIVGVLAIISAAGGYQLQQHLKTDTDKQIVIVKNPIAPKDVIGTKAENFSLNDVNGEQRSLSEWQGKIIVINFWATWCAPCRDSLSGLRYRKQKKFVISSRSLMLIILLWLVRMM
jgi:thiol-disulfide isomerase/thioredoxin